ncbi:MAG TPA: hypothetical protein PKD09_10535 [Aggregatilinea sp.]|uniref:hypothetical protein n=1 Tax=Aggregatilinea sp. TaxID=2806333 RepID=UPI002C0EE72D|nr:hypothetical protein [Aggregatilinea sp.]HML22079.1 hypothetical protein [Aggregatilinea sp.]
MNLTSVTKGLDQMIRTFGSILDDSASSVVDVAKSQAIASRKIYDERKRRTDNPALAIAPWGYTIFPERPLRFKPTEPTKGFDAQVDLFCSVRWENDNELPVEQDICLRVWNQSAAYRDTWDHDRILETLCDDGRTNRNRVMLRCHFDLANIDQLGPRYHLQFGGNPREDELCWFPELINLPRFIYPPMDLVLVCEFVAASFFQDEYNKKLKKDKQWKSVLKLSQQHLLGSYYYQCHQAIERGDSLVGHLWNV